MRGRRPKDPGFKELAGNPGKRRIRHVEAVTAAGAEEFPQPGRLTGGEAAIWRRTVAILSEAGLAKRTDFEALEVYCTTFVRWDKCKKKLNAKGYTYTTPSGYERARPEVAIVERAERILATYQDRLGLNTAARVRTGSLLAGRQLGLPLDAPKPGAPGEQPAPPAQAPDDPVGFITGGSVH